MVLDTKCAIRRQIPRGGIDMSYSRTENRVFSERELYTISQCATSVELDAAGRNAGLWGHGTDVGRCWDGGNWLSGSVFGEVAFQAV